MTSVEPALRRSVACAVLALSLLLSLGVATARADLPDNDIVITPLDGKVDEGGTAVARTAQPRFLMQFNFGSTTNVHVECSTDSVNFTSCGTQVTSSCAASQCWIYQPSFPGDGQGYKVEGAIFDSTLPDNDPNQPMDALNQPVVVDSAPPDTRLTANAPYFGEEGAKSIPVSYAYKTIDNIDQDLWPDDAQCAITTGAAPSSWGRCGSGQRVPLTPQAFRFWVRAVAFSGLIDASPAESPPFSAMPCRATLLSHPRSLRQIVRTGLRMRVSCVQPTGYYVTLQIPTRELVAINLRYRDVTSGDLGHRFGRTRRQGETDVFTLHLLRGIPADLLAYRGLTLDLDTSGGPTVDRPIVIHRVTGR